ncbi:MSCRAMM family protein [Niallia sp. FSL K6-0212]
MVPITATNELTAGAVKLTKVDADDKNLVLEGAEFELQDTEGKVLQESLKTDEDGKILIEGLKPGKYQLVETKAPAYYQLNSEPITFTIEKGQAKALEVVAENSLIPGSVELTKVDADDKNLVLEGAEFVLQDIEGKVLQEGLKTDKDGKIRIEGLKPGKYQMVETKAPAYYQLNSDPIDFTIEKGQAKTLELMVTNKLILGSAIVKKVDEKTNQPLENAHFKLTDKQGNIIMEEGISGRDGSLELIDLLPGEYLLFETKAPNGYKKLSEPIMFEITKGQQEPIVVKVANEKIVSGEQKPTKESDDESGTKGEDSSGSKNNPGKTLPDTATSYFNYILAGVLLIGFSVLIRIRKRGN